MLQLESDIPLQQLTFMQIDLWLDILVPEAAISWQMIVFVYMQDYNEVKNRQFLKKIEVGFISQLGLPVIFFFFSYLCNTAY